MQALVAGGTGLVGRECLRLLAGDAEFSEVRALVRRPLPPGYARDRLRECVADFARLGEHAEWFRAECVFCALGTTIKLNTFDGMTDLEIKPGTQSGDVITLRGKGVTHLRGTGRGDLIVHASVLTPTRLTSEQEALLRQLAELRGEERSDGRLTPVNHGLFGKLRDAFLGK